MHVTAAFDGSTLAGQMAEREYECWFGGRLVPTAGIGGVTVAMEYRGSRLLAPMFERLFAGARGRGAVLSALYPSAPQIYRGFGYEVVGSADRVRIPVAALERVRAPAGVTTRRAVAADVPAIRQIYDRWAAAHNGPLSRRGVSFPTTDEELITSFTGITVAESAGTVIGYASWNRGSSWGPGSGLRVSDLLASEADGYRALLAALSTWSTGIESILINTSGPDPMRTLLPTLHWQVEASDAYMIKVIDVPGAVQARGYFDGLRAEAEFVIAGDTITGTDGRYRLAVSDGHAVCTRSDTAGPDCDVPIFTPNGFVLAYSGAQPCTSIRAVGGLSGTERYDGTFDALFGGRSFAVHDHY